jgi:predicted RNA-binding Zn ribbon-like protein
LLAKPIASHVGGHIALDFCNTAGDHLSAEPLERLRDWECFVRWAVQTDLIEPAIYPELLRHPVSISEVIELREAIFAIGLTFARGEKPTRRAIDYLRECAVGARPPIAITSGKLRWRPQPDEAWAGLRTVLASEALSLFCSDQSVRIGLCDGGACGWLFIDDSRGKRRRWCAMNDCGAKAKAKRHYVKKKDKEG